MTDDPRQHDVRPWERPGAVRRDCEPHRAEMLRDLAVTALVCAGFAGCLAVPAVAGLVLGAAVWLLGRRDRAMMSAGLMDPAGRAVTRDAQSMAVVAAALCLIAAVSWAVVLLTKVSF
jgi:hypothetical protein